MKPILNWKLLPGFALALALFLAVAVLDWQGTHRMQESADWVRHTHEVRWQLAKLFSVIQDIEIGMRGYVIAGQPEYLKPFLEAEAEWKKQFLNVHKLTSNNPRQQANCAALEPLITRRVALARAAVDERQHTSFEAAQQVVETGEGKAVMDEIRDLIGKMEDEEQALLNERELNAQRDFRNVRKTNLILMGSGGLLSIGLFALMLRENRGRLLAERSLMEINARKRAEEALRESEARLNFVLERNRIGVWEMNLVNRTVYRTLTHARIFGYPTLVPGWTYEKFLEHILPEDREWVAGCVQAALAAQRDWEFECRIRRADGEVRWIWVTSGSNQTFAGKLEKISGIVQDITERKQAELATGKLAAIVEFSDDAIIGKDLNGLITSWNHGAEKIFGYTLGEMVGTSIRRLIPEDHQLEEDQILDGIKRGKSIEHFETERLTKDGRRIAVSITTSPIKDAGGRIVGASKVARDITGRKRAEAEILRLNAELEQRVRDRTASLEAANRELEAFSYSVSHDLRSPLRAIDGFSQNLLEDYGDKLDADGRDSLQRVRAASQRLGRLIDELLQLFRYSRSELRRVPVDLSALVQALAEELERCDPERRVEFVIEPRRVAWADPDLIRVVLENLLGNAWKFTAKLPRAKIEFGATPDGDGSVFFVRDNGVGFDMAYAPKLFKAFERLHNLSEFPGTGIGLANVQRLIHRHSGRVWAEGKVNAGATFYFSLPCPPKKS